MVIFFDYVARSIGYIGVMIIAVSSFLALISVFKSFGDMSELRRKFGERILTGLEFIIAGELLIVTITEREIEFLIKIAVIVAIRAVMGFILKKEISD